MVKTCRSRDAIWQAVQAGLADGDTVLVQPDEGYTQEIVKPLTEGDDYEIWFWDRSYFLQGHGARSATPLLKAPDELEAFVRNTKLPAKVKSAVSP